jgi:hypothetical protein
VSFRQEPAGARAAAAGSSASVHSADVFAALRTGIADAGTNGANVPVERRSAQHEVSRGAANLGAVVHQAEIARLDMPSAGLETAVHGLLLAEAVALQTVDDASLQVRGLPVVGHRSMMRMDN